MNGTKTLVWPNQLFFLVIKKKTKYFILKTFSETDM